MPHLFLVLLTSLLATSAVAQDAPVELPTPEREGVDARLFRAIYNQDAPAFRATMRGVNRASVPLFVAIVPAVGAVDLISDGRAGPTARLLLSEGAAIGATFLIKNIVERPRPYVALHDVERRGRVHVGREVDPYSFPSGHAATAFALATSASLSAPEWYVIAPTMAWATTTAVARVWHGMHYPSDIVVGAVLGAGVATLVHVIVERDDETGAEIDPAQLHPAFTFRIPIR